MNYVTRSLIVSRYLSYSRPKLSSCRVFAIGTRDTRTGRNRNVVSRNHPSEFKSPCRRFISATNHPETLSWDDHEDIAELLHEEYPSTNPLSLRFTELHDNVASVVLASTSKPIIGKCSEGALEKIQMAWLELREDTNS